MMSARHLGTWNRNAGACSSSRNGRIDVVDASLCKVAAYENEVISRYHVCNNKIAIWIDSGDQSVPDSTEQVDGSSIHDDEQCVSDRKRGAEPISDQIYDASRLGRLERIRFLSLLDCLSLLVCRFCKIGTGFAFCH